MGKDHDFIRHRQAVWALGLLDGGVVVDRFGALNFESCPVPFSPEVSDSQFALRHPEERSFNPLSRWALCPKAGEASVPPLPLGSVGSMDLSSLASPFTKAKPPISKSDSGE